MVCNVSIGDLIGSFHSSDCLTDDQKMFTTPINNDSLLSLAIHAQFLPSTNHTTTIPKNAPTQAN
jgi:hypothetical protein